MQDWNTICRICLEEKQSYFLIPISVAVEEGSIIELIRYLSSIVINEDDTEYPKNVCHQCLQQLKVGCEIKRKCVESNEKLCGLLIDVKTEPKVEFVEIEQIQVQEEIDTYDIWGDNDYSDYDDTQPSPVIPEILYDEEDEIIEKPVKRVQIGGRKAQPKEFNLPLKFPKTLIKHKFTCDFCGLVIQSKSHLMGHFRKEHKTKKELVCSLCNLGFRYASSLNVHKRYHRGERQFKCDQCPKEFILNCELLRHKRNHTGQNMKLCDFCGKVFSSHYLKTHVVLCEKKAMENPQQLEDARIAMLDFQIEYTCDFCNLTVKGKSFLETHIRRTHLKKQVINHQKVFQCNFPDCDKKFQQRYNMVIHKRLHTNKSSFPCDKCNRVFIKEALLAKHQNSSACHGNLVSCSLCEKLFRSKEIMEKHYDLKHVQKEKKVPEPKIPLEFFCEFCGKRITSRPGLQKHLLVYHKEESKYKEYPVFKCRFCIKEFHYRHDLMIHECYHTNERPFKCDIPGCSKAFVQKNRVTSIPWSNFLQILMTFFISANSTSTVSYQGIKRCREDIQMYNVCEGLC